MTGYTEILTDPSYHGQILCLTTAEVGVCGARGTRAFIAECCSGSRFSAEGDGVGYDRDQHQFRT